MCTFLSVDEAAFTDTHWRQFHSFLVNMHARGFGNVPPSTAQALRQRIEARLALRDGFREWVIVKDSAVVGWLGIHVRPGSETAPPVMFLVFDFVPGLEVAPLSARAAGLVAAAMRENRCGEVHCMAAEAHLDSLRQTWGGRILSRLHRYRLDRRTANRDLINEWLAEFPRQFPSLRIEIFTEIPERHLDSWIALFGQFLADMPNEGTAAAPFTMTRAEVRKFEALRRRNGQYLYTGALLDGEGRMIGHSNMATHDDPPMEWHQAMTGIERAWRGRGLSKWLKAALFVRTGEDFPQSRYIWTEMRAVNEPIHLVNRAMGFELSSEGYEWSIDRAALDRLAG